MITVKVKDLRVLFLLNREVLGSAEIKKAVESPLGVSIIAQKNYKELEAAIRKEADAEEDIKKLAARKDDKGNPVIIEIEKVGKTYDVPAETQAEFEAQIIAHSNKELSLVLSQFSEPVAEKIVLFLKDEQGCSAASKTSLLIEFLTDIKS